MRGATLSEALAVARGEEVVVEHDGMPTEPTAMLSLLVRTVNDTLRYRPEIPKSQHQALDDVLAGAARLLKDGRP